MTDGEQLRFDNRVAIVTGGGGDLGAAYVNALAARGAAVVVADLPAEMGRPDHVVPAPEVAAHVRAQGGVAVAVEASVATARGAAIIASRALDEFGRIDVLVNNAGILGADPIATMTETRLRLHIEVSLLGTVFLTRAVWPTMVAAGYGRIVNTSSSSIFGMRERSAYTAAKAGVYGFTRSIAAEGLPLGIRANCIAPTAVGRRPASGVSAEVHEYRMATSPPRLAAPGVIYLAHESCALNGELLNVGGGRVSRIFLAESRPMLDPELTAEAIAAHLDTIIDPAGARIWTDIDESVRARLAEQA